MLNHFLRASSFKNNSLRVYSTTSNIVSTSGNNITVTTPNGLEVGDIIVAFLLGSGTSAVWDQLSGFTRILSTNVRSIQIKTATATEPSSYTFGSSSSMSRSAVIMVVIKNAAYDLVGTISTASSTPVAPSITLTTSNSLVLAYFSEDRANAFMTTPSGYKIVNEFAYDKTLTMSVFVSTGYLPSGATGTVTSTITLGGNAGRGVLLGIKPS